MIQIDIENNKVTDSFTFGGKLSLWVRYLCCQRLVEGDTIQGIAHVLTETLCLQAQGRVKGNCIIPVSEVQSIYKLIG